MQTKNVQQSLLKKGFLGIVGHAGVGHVHGGSGYIQEGTGGFAVLAGLLAKTLQVDLTFESVELNGLGTQLILRTKSGGEGTAFFDQGFTPWEARLIRQIVGMSSYAPQTLAQQLLGRISGQGSNPAATVLCEAISKAIMDSLYRTNPERFLRDTDDLPGSSGCFLGTVLDFDDIPVSCLLSVSCCCNGIGPNEDAQGNILIGAKGRMMRQLGMDRVPCIVLDGKIYVPEISSRIEEVQLFIRLNDEHDNIVVGKCLKQAVRSLGFEVWAARRDYPRSGDDLGRYTQKIGKEIAQIGEEFSRATEADAKIRLAAMLADKVATEMGGAAFMSNDLNKLVGNGGLWPGSGARLGLIVPETYIKYWKIPAVIEADIINGIHILYRAVPLLWENREEACAMYEQRKP